MKKKKKPLFKKNYLKAIVISVIYQIVVVACFNLISFTAIKRVFVLLGGDLSNGGIIQGFIVFTSLWAYFDLAKARKRINAEFKALCFSLLPTGEKHVLLPMDLPKIQENVDKYKGHNFLLVKLLSAALLKFKSTASMGETIEVISIQSEIHRDIHDSDQSNIRYLLWLIPSIGFMGTVIGISQALQIANSGDMSAITATLGVAFDTTLVALVLSAIVTGLFHKLQEETEKLHSHLKDYVITNFVNKLEIQKFSQNNSQNDKEKKVG